MFRKPTPRFHINPRFRAYGKARIDLTRRATSLQEWQSHWRGPMQPFAFTWNGPLKMWFEYKVEDYAAEVGFWMDVIGLPVNTFSPSFAIFASPDQSFHFAVRATQEKEPATPPEAIRLQFAVNDLGRLAAELERRGIVFDCPPQQAEEDASQLVAVFRTPNGMYVDLWSEATSVSTRTETLQPAQTQSWRGSQATEAIELDSDEDGDDEFGESPENEELVEDEEEKEPEVEEEVEPPRLQSLRSPAGINLIERLNSRMPLTQRPVPRNGTRPAAQDYTYEEIEDRKQ